MLLQAAAMDCGSTGSPHGENTGITCIGVPVQCGNGGERTSFPRSMRPVAQGLDKPLRLAEGATITKR